MGCLLIVGGAFVAVTATFVTFILPSRFASAARVAPAVTGQTAIATEMQKIQSGAVLSQVASNLTLSKRWEEKYKEAELPAHVTESLLKGMLAVEQVRGTDLIEVRVFADTPEEAAEIANEVVEAYRASPLAPGGTAGKPGVAVVDKAQANHRPASPNKALNILGGWLAGGLLATAGVWMVVLAFRRMAAAVGP